jgi:hypothetical protein
LYFLRRCFTIAKDYTGCLEFEYHRQSHAGLTPLDLLHLLQRDIDLQSSAGLAYDGIPAGLLSFRSLHDFE